MWKFYLRANILAYLTEKRAFRKRRIDGVRGQMLVRQSTYITWEEWMSQAVMMVIGDCGKESVLSPKLDGVIAVTHVAKRYGYAHNPQRLLQTRKIFRSDM